MWPDAHVAIVQSSDTNRYCSPILTVLYLYNTVLVLPRPDPNFLVWCNWFCTVHTVCALSLHCISYYEEFVSEEQRGRRRIGNMEWLTENGEYCTVVQRSRCIRGEGKKLVKSERGLGVTTVTSYRVPIRCFG